MRMSTPPVATMSPALGSKPGRISPPHVPYSELFRNHTAFRMGTMYFQVSIQVQFDSHAFDQLHGEVDFVRGSFVDPAGGACPPAGFLRQSGTY